jgi:two-component system, LytTR family, response regulator
MATTPPVTAIIVDDEPLSRTTLKDLITRYAKEVQVKALCKSAKEGLAAIERWNPDIIFLDIIMPGMTGFDMLRQMPAVKGQIIFTTSYEKFAIEAIRFAALDYLLKPIEPAMLQDAVNVAIEKIRSKEKKARPMVAEGNTSRVLESLPIPTMEGCIMLKISDITYCEADGRITKLFMIDKKMEAATRNLGDFEKLLEPYGFYRIHKSHLINIKQLKKYIKGEGGQVVMADNKTLDVSRRAKAGLLELIGL